MIEVMDDKDHRGSVVLDIHDKQVLMRAQVQTQHTTLCLASYFVPSLVVYILVIAQPHKKYSGFSLSRAAYSCMISLPIRTETLNLLHSINYPAL